MLSNNVLPHSSKAESICSEYGRGNLKFGVELEVEVKPLPWRLFRHDDDEVNKASEAIHSLLNPPRQEFIITKEDGSLDNGFEIVSAPATWGECVKRWKPLFDVKKLPVKVKKTCGMHVHFTRAAIKPTVLEHIVEFVTLPKNRKFVVKIAGRNNPEYARLVKKDVNWIHNTYPYDFWRTERTSNGEITFDRFEAINVTGTKTIEFRLFASTLDKDKFYTRLEFVKACIDFAKRSGEWKPLVEAFIPMVQNSDEYPHLLQFITNNNLAPDESGADPTVT